MTAAPVTQRHDLISATLEAAHRLSPGEFDDTDLQIVLNMVGIRRDRNIVAQARYRLELRGKIERTERRSRKSSAVPTWHFRILQGDLDGSS